MASIWLSKKFSLAAPVPPYALILTVFNVETSYFLNTISDSTLISGSEIITSFAVGSSARPILKDAPVTVSSKSTSFSIATSPNNLNPSG